VKLIIDRLAQDEVAHDRDRDRASVRALMALQNDAGETPLYIAAENNLVDMLSFLLNFCDPQIAGIRSRADLDAFHVAAKRGHLGIFNFFP